MAPPIGDRSGGKSKAGSDLLLRQHIGVADPLYTVPDSQGGVAAGIILNFAMVAPAGGGRRLS